MFSYSYSLQKDNINIETSLKFCFILTCYLSNKEEHPPAFHTEELLIGTSQLISHVLLVSTYDKYIINSAFKFTFLEPSKQVNRRSF